MANSSGFGESSEHLPTAQINHEYVITDVNLKMKQRLSVATMPFVPIDVKATNADSQVTIKDEPLPSIVVKEEVTTEPDKLLEVEFIPVNCIKSEINFEEDISDRENDAEEHLSKYDSSFTIKDEPLACTDMTEEVKSEPYQMLEVECFPVNFSESQITCHRDSSDKDKDVQLTKPDNPKMVFSCNNCSKIFDIKSKLMTHIRNSHSKIKQKRYSSTKKHTETTSMIEDKTIHNQKQKLACHVCDKQFNKKSVLVAHIKIHTGEKPFFCHVCDKQFTQKSAVVTHMRIHTGERPFSCHICEKQFIQKSALVTHKRTHTDEKPFVCNVCEKQFRQKYALVSHIRTHTDEKPFVCNICEKQFRQKFNLASHIRVHTGEKPFACNVCDKRFNRKFHLVSHERLHTGEKPFACHVCVKRFYDKGSLRKHEVTHR